MDAQQNHRHLPGPFKQPKKAHKHGKHRSKREIDRVNQGRVALKMISKKNRPDLSRTERRNRAQQIRKGKREKVLAKKRGIGGEKSAPHYVAVISLNDSCCPENLVKLLTECDKQVTVTRGDCGSVHTCYPRYKQRVAYIIADITNLHALLDTVSACDTVLFLWSLDLLDERAEYNYKSIYAHGMPSHIHAVMGIKSTPKKQSEMRRVIQMEIDLRFVEGKLHMADTDSDAQNLVRSITQAKVKIPRFREIRPTVLCEKLEWISDQSMHDDKQTSDEQKSLGTLRVSGYVKGCGLSVNRLVHIPGYGDYQLEKITAPTDPHPLILKPENLKPVKSEDEEEKLLAQADVNRQSDLKTENEMNELEGEQTWPTAEEIIEAQMEQKRLLKVPKGTSSYQAAWITDNAGDVNSVTDGVSDLIDSDEELSEFDPVSAADSDEEMEINERGSVSGSIARSSVASKSVTWGDDAAYDKGWDEVTETAQLEMFKKEREQVMFPDEIDTPDNIPARERFARYRGLSSFRTSPWDPKENLPQDYSRIYQFENFSRFRRHIVADEPQDAVIPGWYVNVYIKNVSKHVYDTYSQMGSSLVLIGLLPHEHRMSVLHFAIKRHASHTEPIRNKEPMVVHCGFRRYICNPVYSDHSNANKHKMEMFLPQCGVCIASVYAPITFPPCPVSFYKQVAGRSEPDLVASGSLFSVDPDRIMLKRLVLSGHPLRINKRNAVIRYMFWNRDDIVWFKPIELKTKYGRRGHIREPLGTHGHLKCLFDQQLRSQDTVLMMLYKRVYPKWTYDPDLTINLSLQRDANDEEQSKPALMDE